MDRREPTMALLVQMIVTGLVTISVLLLLASLASTRGGVGSAELLVLLAPAVVVGIRVGRWIKNWRTPTGAR